ncbi:sensor histidine kinase [Wenzhouxiangella sp. EGI_FJ10409]|uniref:sensor histidine kinase n=1 Tax=Wenzhouxiangella sp. EGI_FJ10409 TaxID=3243767 RepID=UPI0035DAD81E
MSLRRRIEILHRFLVPPESGQSWTAYLWLVYFAFFFVEWYFRPVGPLELVLGLATVAVFLVLYFSAYRRIGATALWHILAIAALAAAWSFTNAGASVLFIYAAAFAHLVGPPRKAVWVVLGIAAFAAVIAPLARPEPFYWMPGVFISLMIGMANIFFAEQGRKNAELKLGQAEIKRLARVAERERIARDLHDVLGHTLSMIAVKSELAERLVDRDRERAREEIRSMGESAREALADVRKAIGGYQHQTLEETLEHMRLSLRAADIDPDIDVDDDIDLPAQTQGMLALILREAVTNVIRHSQARHCRIRIEASNGELSLAVEDDGGGRIRMDGNGIQGMRARIESLGGTLTIGARGSSSLHASIPKETA